jgi:prevent-host-death family protein
MEVDQVMSATYVRRHLEAVVRHVEQTRERVLVTKYGRPVVVIEPPDAKGTPSPPGSASTSRAPGLP